jgi:hypothetical protein
MPHFDVAGSPILDLLGPDSTLIRFDASLDVSTFTKASQEAGLPISVVDAVGPVDHRVRAHPRDRPLRPARRLAGRRPSRVRLDRPLTRRKYMNKHPNRIATTTGTGGIGTQPNGTMSVGITIRRN